MNTKDLQRITGPFTVKIETTGKVTFTAPPRDAAQEGARKLAASIFEDEIKQFGEMLTAMMEQRLKDEEEEKAAFDPKAFLGTLGRA